MFWTKKIEVWTHSSDFLVHFIVPSVRRFRSQILDIVVSTETTEEGSSDGFHGTEGCVQDFRSWGWEESLWRIVLRQGEVRDQIQVLLREKALKLEFREE